MSVNSNNPVVHPKAIVEPGAVIGERTQIRAFSHVRTGARIGKDCVLCDHTFIENDVVIGDGVTIQCGVSVWNGIELQDQVFVGPNVVFSSDQFPRRVPAQDQPMRTVVCRGASLGAGAVILPGLRIGEKAMVAAGSVVTRDVPQHAIVTGNPAHIIGYVDTVSHPSPSPVVSATSNDSVVAGVKLIHLKHVEDMRGDLCVAEWYRDLPFVPRRVFFVYNVPDSRVRGEHAHMECHQFLVCVKGNLSIVADDGSKREEFVLDQPWIGLYLPPRIWGIQYKYSSDTVLMVFASHEYNPADYVRQYDEFLKLTRS